MPRQPPIRGQRKIFPFISRIFLCSPRGKGLAAEYAGRLAARCGSLPRGLPSRSVTPTEDNVCKDTLKHVDIPRLAVCARTRRVRAYRDRCVAPRTRQTPSNLDCTLHSAHSCVFALCRQNADPASIQSRHTLLTAPANFLRRRTPFPFLLPSFLPLSFLSSSLLSAPMIARATRLSA